MERGIPGVEQLPDSMSAKRAFLAVQRDFSVGLSSPILITVEGDADDPEVAAALERLTRVVETDGRFELLSTEESAGGGVTLLKAAINEDATSDAAMQSVRELREELVPQAVAGAPVTAMVGGVPGLYTDATDMIDVYTPVVIGVVLMLSFVLLLFAFRSLVIAVKAILMNLLSVGAAFGVITLIFQEGHLTGLLGFQQVPSIAAWLPLMMFCVLFGLSMDYHVFLLSRVREEYDRSGDTSRAVVFGLSSTAGLITGAALIMVAVFGGVAAGDLTMFQQLGVGLAVAVALDATVVRVVVVPSAMAILGTWNWYLPRWLEWLPRVSVEARDDATSGSSVSAPATSGDATDPAAVTTGASASVTQP
jgi:RND superfamily putative drug exporter